jgi:hypothetical protein
MIRELAFKPDFGDTIDRFEAWWQGDFLDRPPVTVHVKRSRQPRDLPTPPVNPRERWTRIDYVLETAIAHMAATDYVGDHFPCFNPNLGPEITATVFGCDLEFSETTSWSKPVVHDPSEWLRIIQMQPKYHNRYWRAIEEITDAAISGSTGRFLVGITDLHGNYDILAAIRDPQALCMDLIDCPDLVRKAGRHVAHAFVGCFERLYTRLATAGMGSTCWLATYHAGPAYVPSCDFWCMVDGDTARNLILPDILIEMEPLQRSIFHLDGPQALRHLDLLLEIPQLNAIQWVFGAGNGPASTWIDTYKRITAAGKSIAVHAADPADALTVLDAVGPEGVWLTVDRPFDSIASAESFLDEVTTRSRALRRKPQTSPKPQMPGRSAAPPPQNLAR